MSQQSSDSQTGVKLSSCRCLNSLFSPGRVVWEEPVWAADSRRCRAGPVVGEEAWGCGLRHHGHSGGDERHVPECRDPDDQQQRGDTRDHHGQSKTASAEISCPLKSSDKLLYCRSCAVKQSLETWRLCFPCVKFLWFTFVKAPQWKLWGDHAADRCADWWTPRWGGIHHRLGEGRRAEGPHH